MKFYDFERKRRRSMGKSSVYYICTCVHGFSTMLQRVVAVHLRNRIYRERRFLNLIFRYNVLRLCMYA